MMTEDRDDLSTLIEVDVQSSIDVEINTNRFRMLCDNVQNCFYEIDNSMFEILELKDKLLLQYLPRNVLLQITLILSRFYRAYSQSQVPIYELIRLVQLYSGSFDIKCSLLKRLYDSNETKKRMLNFALQKITSMENNVKHYQEQKCIDNWEKMYIRLALPRSNVRKWKFRIKTFREKAELGYEHVIEWIDVRIPRPSLTLDILPNKDPIDDEDADRLEIVNIQETNEPKLQTGHDSNHDNKIGIDNGSNLLTENSKAKQIDIEIQVQPDSDDQQTSTEDILSTKSIIMRIYRPIGIAKTKFQCIVYAQGQQYTTKVFIFNKSNAPSTTVNRITRTKKRNKVSTTSDNIDINTLDKQQVDEFFIPMPSVLKRRSLFQTDIDPDAIKIEIFGDEKLCGSLILSSEDLRMLDLPNLHNQIFSPLIAINDNISTDFDQTSNELYQSWLCRTPHFFSIYNNKYESIGKLPLLIFWYNKLENIHATKSTMTDLMETRISTPPKLVSTEKIEIVIPPDETNSVDDRIEILKATYEDDISNIHEYYHTEIHRLTNLLNKILSGQMIETSELDENTLEIIQENTPKPEVVYGKDLPKKFLDRYEMYLQRRIINRHQLIAKIEQQTALANERQMEIQHRLYKPEQNTEYHEDLCLPAVFMPFRSGNVFNPRAYRYFHPVGSTAPRLTQSPSILKFPSLPSRSVSVLNLFELSRKYENSNEKDRPKTQTSD